MILAARYSEGPVTDRELIDALSRRACEIYRQRIAAMDAAGEKVRAETIHAGLTAEERAIVAAAGAAARAEIFGRDPALVA